MSSRNRLCERRSGSDWFSGIPSTCSTVEWCTPGAWKGAQRAVDSLMWYVLLQYGQVCGGLECRWKWNCGGVAIVRSILIGVLEDIISSSLVSRRHTSHMRFDITHISNESSEGYENMYKLV